MFLLFCFFFFFSSRRRHTRYIGDWSSDVCSSDLMPSSLFLAAGGYHHHLGVNTWRGEGLPPAPPRTVGLREWTLVVERGAFAELHERLGGETATDPWNIRLRIAAAT